MLDPGRYLLGVVEILLLGGSAWLGGGAVRSRLLRGFRGAPAQLATAVIAAALLIWAAELLGSFGALDPVPYLAVVALVGIGLWKSLPRPPGGDDRGRGNLVLSSVAVLIAAVAVVHFAGGVEARLSTGMTGFDSTWYHGTFAAGFFQSGDTWDLHFIAPQFLAWFYPANSEIFHAVGMLAFGRDLLSPLLNLGWFMGCLVACWCIGRPYRVAPWSLALGAIALSVPALTDQAGEARNDIVGIFFLLAAIAVAVNAWTRDVAEPEGRQGEDGGRYGAGSFLVVGLAAGLAAGTKLNFLLPAVVLVGGMAAIAPPGLRWRSLAAGAFAALAGGGYWYLRNLAHTGNPLPWVHHLGPIDLPAPGQALGGREAHTVLGYLTDGSVWSNWFLPGLHHGLWLIWPLLVLAAVTGLLGAATPLLRSRVSLRSKTDRKEPGTGFGGQGELVLAIAGLVGLASALAWLVAPTSASGPDGMPRGFESGLRYLAPALILGLALLPSIPPLRGRLAQSNLGWLSSGADGATKLSQPAWGTRSIRVFVGVSLIFLAVLVGYPVQRHYLQDRYKEPTFTAPGLNAAFAWARDLTDARIATTSTRQYPLFGTDLSNHVQFLGTEQPHGGFEAATTCRQYRRLLNQGDYDYVIATRDRLEPARPAYPPQALWTEAPQAKVVLKQPPTVVFKLHGRLDPSACGAGGKRPPSGAS